MVNKNLMFIYVSSIAPTWVYVVIIIIVAAKKKIIIIRDYKLIPTPVSVNPKKKIKSKKKINQRMRGKDLPIIF